MEKIDGWKYQGHDIETEKKRAARARNSSPVNRRTQVIRVYGDDYKAIKDYAKKNRVTAANAAHQLITRGGE